MLEVDQTVAFAAAAAADDDDNAVADDACEVSGQKSRHPKTAVDTSAVDIVGDADHPYLEHESLLKHHHY